MKGNTRGLEGPHVTAWAAKKMGAEVVLMGAGLALQLVRGKSLRHRMEAETRRGMGVTADGLLMVLVGVLQQV